MEYFSRGFTIVTDGTAVMARVANALVWREIHAPSETWMNWMAHALNNVIKSVLASLLLQNFFRSESAEKG